MIRHLALPLALLAAATVAHATTVTRGPYLQTMTSSSVIVRWRTDVPTTSRVMIGTTIGALGTNVDDPTSTTEHVVTVSSLAADTQYVYAIGSDTETLEGDDANHVFRTAPPAGPARPFRAWVTGDGGFVNVNGYAVRDAYTAFAGSTPTDLFLLLGDNAYLLGTDADYQAALFGMHHDMLLHTPAVPVFGNHEAFSSNSLTQVGPFFDMFSLPTAGQAGGVASGSEAYFSFDWANVHFVVLDSENNSSAAGSPMRTWLDADLAATTADWIVAMWHRPPYSKGQFHDSDTEAGEIAMRQNILPVLEAHGVDLVLNGHSHNYERSYLLDGHYGLSTTFSEDLYVKDGGDGDPAEDGAYRKATVGAAPHEGTVYVVAGSSSEVRTATTLNHPAMLVGLFELGSVVLDVDGTALTSRFLNSAGEVTDTFRIEKGNVCGTAPRGGCAAGVKGKLTLKQGGTDAADKVAWVWKDGNLPSAALGDPLNQTDVAWCVYDATGALVGGGVKPEKGWTASATKTQFADKLGAQAGLQKLQVKPAVGTKAGIVVKGKGAGLGVPTLPGVGPFTAQLVNLDSGACWESTFSTVKKNDATTLVASQP